MDFNFMKLLFSILMINTTVLSFFYVFNKNYLSPAMGDIIRYGKLMQQSGAVANSAFVPKRYFRHFYIFTGPIITTIFFMTINTHFNGKTPNIVYTILDIALGSSRKANVSPEATLLGVILMSTHMWKRFYEAHYVSIFSDTKMNISHYVVGFIHYIGVLLCIIGESSGFVRDSSGIINLSNLSNNQLIAAFIFFLATYKQFQTNVILANLRRNKDGEIVTKEYKVPTGRFFNYISCPLQFTEILVYAMISIVLWESTTWHYVTVWVVANQIAGAYLQHQWYIEKFENYPSNRRIIFPFLL